MIQAGAVFAILFAVLVPTCLAVMWCYRRVSKPHKTKSRRAHHRLNTRAGGVQQQRRRDGKAHPHAAGASSLNKAIPLPPAADLGWPLGSEVSIELVNPALVRAEVLPRGTDIFLEPKGYSDLRGGNWV